MLESIICMTRTAIVINMLTLLASLGRLLYRLKRDLFKNSDTPKLSSSRYSLLVIVFKSQGREI